MTELVRYNEMCKAIAACHQVDEVKDIRDKAMALEHYAKQALNMEAEQQAREVRLRAERKTGQLLRDTEKAKGTRLSSGSNTVRPPEQEKTLSDMGISKTQSSRWQRLAEVPDEEFEAALASDEKPSTSGLIQKPSIRTEDDPDRIDDDALWYWGELVDWERRGLFGRKYSDLLTGMTPEMREDVARLTPVLADWIGDSNIG